MTTVYSETIDRLLLEGESLVRAQRFAEGEQRAREVLGHQPKNPGGHYILALSALLQGRHGEALPHVESALRADRVNAQYHFMAALCHTGLGRAEEAKTCYRRALQYRPEFFEARANLAYMLETEARFDEAVEHYRRVLKDHPDEWFSLNRMGYCSRILGKPEEALAYLERALQIRPDFAPTMNEIALALVQLQRKPEAIAMFRRAVEADPQFLSAWCNLGKVLYLEHVVAEPGTPAADPQPVLECFDRILALDPVSAEFAYLRDCVAGNRVARPPDGYIEAFFDRFAHQFDAKLVDELQYRGPEAAAEFLGPWLAARQGLRIVDLGCGTGLSGPMLRAAAGTLIGVDLSTAMLEHARQRGTYDELVHGEVVAWLDEQQPGSVHCALALEVFNYIGELRPVFTAAARALGPGGRLAFSVELAETADFSLSPNGRYAHSPEYVKACAADAGLALGDSREVAIRREAQKPVKALLFAFDKA